jgi:hypothetical protein
LDLAVERALILSATGALTPHAKDCISKTIDNYENEIRRLRNRLKNKGVTAEHLIEDGKIVERLQDAEAEVERLKESDSGIAAQATPHEKAIRLAHDLAEEVVDLREKLTAHEEAMREALAKLSIDDERNHERLFEVVTILRARLEEK